jgi:hypothetical protein
MKRREYEYKREELLTLSAYSLTDVAFPREGKKN